MNQGTVILCPGNFGSTLADTRQALGGTIWINPVAIIGGGFAKLSLPSPAGVNIQATGIIPGYFNFMESAINSAGFTAIPFAFDWRQDVDTIAATLCNRIASTPPPIYVITHSLGSLVARRAIQLLAAQKGTDQVMAAVKGLIMLGPCTYGTLAGALALAGATSELPLLGSFPPAPPYIQPILATFTSLYQVLPWDASKLPSLNDADHNIRTSGFWRGLINTDTLFRCLPPSLTPWAATIDTTFFTPNTRIVLGDANNTAGGVVFRGGAMVVDPSYNVPGDGFVPRACSLSDDHPMTYIASGVGHLQLPVSHAVIQGVVALLEGSAPTTITSYSQ